MFPRATSIRLDWTGCPKDHTTLFSTSSNMLGHTANTWSAPVPRENTGSTLTALGDDHQAPVVPYGEGYLAPAISAISFEPNVMDSILAPTA